MEVVLPGDVVGATRNGARAGDNVYAADETLYSSVYGQRVVDGPVVSVQPLGRRATGVPDVGAVVLCRVLRVTAAMATAEVVSVDGRAVAESFSAVLKKENVRDTNIDEVIMADCFRPGDIVRASIAALGDARTYFLSTAGPEGGVVAARSEEGNEMRPLTLEVMEDTETGKREKRKVARL
jgi:exosome complex component CSL4